MSVTDWKSEGLTDDENFLIAAAQVAGYTEFPASLAGAKDFLNTKALMHEKLAAAQFAFENEEGV